MKPRKPLRSKAAKGWKPPTPTPYHKLKRKTPIKVTNKHTVSGPIPKEERDDRARLQWLKSTVLWCQICGVMRHLEVSHHPKRGHGAMGQKPSHFRTIRACARCHREQWHQRGHYDGMTPEESRELNEALIRENNLKHAEER